MHDQESLADAVGSDAGSGKRAARKPSEARPRQAALATAGRLRLLSLARLALRLMWRDWRGGELRLLLMAMIMAVASVSGIALFTDRLERALLQESASMLAADRVLSGREQPPRAWLGEASERGLETAEYISFTSMAFSDRGNVLVAAKAVSDSYPLRGELQVADVPFGQPYQSDAGGPAPGEVWLESRAFAALDLVPGELVYVGESEFVVSRVLVQEPDRQQGGVLDNAGPRLLMHLDDLPATNVIQPGSRVSYRYLFAGSLPALEGFAAWIDEQDAGQYRLRDVRDESQEVADALGRAESFLMLGSLFAVLLAGIAIALTARRYSERHLDYAAILKTLGCTSGQVTTVYATILAVMLLVAVPGGWLIGWGVHQGILTLLAPVLPVQLPGLSAAPFVIGAITAVICLFAFALPPLLALRYSSPLRVLRKDLGELPLRTSVPYLVGALGALALIIWYSQDIWISAVVVAGVAGVTFVLGGLSWVLLRSGVAAGMRAGSAWMLALSAVRRRRQQSVLQMLVFALTIMALLTLALLRTDLIDDWRAQLPENTPNHFLMNITADQVPGLVEFAESRGLEAQPFYPMVSAGLLAVNEAPAPIPWSEEAGSGRSTVTERSGGDMDADDSSTDGAIVTRQVTWTDRLPPDNEVVAGNWWREGGADAGQVSVELDYAQRLGLQLGDELVFRVGETEIEATVASFRTVRWDNMQPNFFFIFSPGTLDFLGATYLSTLLLEGDDKLLLNDMLRAFPTVVVLEVDAIIEQIQNIITQVSAAIELIALLVLVSGALVLLACVNATLDERLRENALLRTLGAGRRLILGSLGAEFAFIGLVAGLIGTIGAEASLYYLQTTIFQQGFAPHYWAWFAGPLSGMVIITTLGLAATRRVVDTSPLVVLRQVAI